MVVAKRDIIIIIIIIMVIIPSTRCRVGICGRVVCARLLYRILLCKCSFGPRWPQVGVPEDDSRVSVSGTEKSYFKIYCNYIMYTHKPCLFSRDHRFFVVFFLFVLYIVHASYITGAGTVCIVYIQFAAEYHSILVTI